MTILVLAAILALCAGAVFWFIRRSPEGHEDREGYHPGAAKKPPGREDNQD